MLSHAAIADISRRQTAKFSSLTYFLDRFPCLLGNGVTVDEVEEDFRLLQSSALDDGIITKRADEAWRELGVVESGEKQLFCKPLPKNKTECCASLSTKMLRSLVTRKVMIACRGSTCYKETFTDALLKKSQISTHNKLHNANV